MKYVADMPPHCSIDRAALHGSTRARVLKLMHAKGHDTGIILLKVKICGITQIDGSWYGVIRLFLHAPSGHLGMTWAGVLIMQIP